MHKTTRLTVSTEVSDLSKDVDRSWLLVVVVKEWLGLSQVSTDEQQCIHKSSHHQVLCYSLSCLNGCSLLRNALDLGVCEIRCAVLRFGGGSEECYVSIRHGRAKLQVGVTNGIFLDTWLARRITRIFSRNGSVSCGEHPFPGWRRQTDSHLPHVALIIQW